ncbi:hypothetical protein [Sphingomonas sp.]|uniref:hypothetical protein n=1 Tax=Sphingomonas sp. TaxID=28214 RepID=UPI002DD663A6|nr:hypothetical protein [Sphingomonas sp.]
MLMRRLILLACLPLAACAAPEARLRTGLESAGLSRPLSACMAERMVDRLSLLQLRRMAGLPKVGGSQTVSQFLYRLRSLGDPEIVSVATSSAALCASGLSR